MNKYTFKTTFHENIVTQKELEPYQLKVWRIILNKHVEIGEYFTNSLRIDNHPGAKLYEVNGIIYLSDYASIIWNRATIFSVLMTLHNTSYKEALHLMKFKYLAGETFDISLENVKPLITEFDFKLEFETRPWDFNDFVSFYNTNLNLTVEDFEKEYYYPVKKYWMNSRHNTEDMICIKPKVCLGYELPEYKTKKLKFPNENKNRKWLSNIKHGQIGGNEEINNFDLLIVTKSLNDYFAFIKSGYNCKFLKDESETLTDNFIAFCNLFERVLFIMDNDDPGLRAINRLAYEWITKVGNKRALFSTLPRELNSKGIKDPFDFMRLYTIDNFKHQIDNILKHETVIYENRFMVQPSATLVC